MTGPQFPRAYKGRKPSYSRKFETAQALLGKPSEGGLLDFLEAAWRPLDVIGDSSKRLITPTGRASLELTSRTPEPLSDAGPVQGRKGVKL